MYGGNLRRQLGNPGFGGFLHDMPNDFLCDAFTPRRAPPADTPEQPPSRDLRRCGPAVNRRLDPAGHRYGSDVRGFADQIGDDPVILSLLKVLHSEVRDLAAPQPTRQHHRKNRAVAAALQALGVWSPEESLTLFGSQPVA